MWKGLRRELLRGPSRCCRSWTVLWFSMRVMWMKWKGEGYSHVVVVVERHFDSCISLLVVGYLIID